MIDGPLIDLLSLLGVVLVALFVWAALSPFEALGWWAGWFGQEIYQMDLPPDGPIRAPRADPDCFIVYLSGISNVSGETLSQREINFLKRLAELMPNAVILDDIFPYSVNNLPLTGQPVFANLWRWTLRRKLSDNWLERLAGYLINVRNIWQVAISLDKRYGPIYNQAMAQVILDNLGRYGFDPEQKVPVVLVGYSGAGQIAVGCANYLDEFLPGPVFVISLGGIIGSDPGLLAADHVYHIFGTADRPQRLGAIVSPGRWSIVPYSSWNRARRLGRLELINVGPMTHGGGTGYLTRSKDLPEGISHLEKTCRTIAELPIRLRPPLAELE